MRKLLIASAMIIIGSAVLAAPGVKIPGDTWNFGKVIQNATTTHTFWIKSTGTDTLRITAVEPGCGCTQLPLSDSSIAPGDSLRLDIIFSTKSFVGNVNKRPFIVTNANPTNANMSIYAEILTEPEGAKPITMRPAKLDVSQFTTTARRRASFELVNKSPETLKLLLVDTLFKNFTVEMPKSIKPGETVQGTIIVKKGSIEKSFKESFTFEALGSETRDRFTLPVERLYRPKDASAAAGTK
jgi:hypothetical protein